MKNLKSKLKNFGVGLGITGLSLLPFKLQAQENLNTTDKGKTHLALSLLEFNNDAARQNTGVLVGAQLGYSKEIFNEIYGRISNSYSFANNKKRDYKISMFDVGPQIEWHPTINGEKVIYFGAGFRYRYLKATNKETNNEETHNGIGFAINFGWDEKLKGTDNYFYLETEYDQMKSDDDLKMGFIKLNAGFKF